MTTRLRVKFDGKVLIPEDPVDLPVGETIEVMVQPTGAEQQVPQPASRTPLQKLADLAAKYPPDPNSPGDAAAQHDHYLYGTPKRHDP